MYDLVPKYDARDSFYHKAKVEDTDSSTILYSYGTKVCELKKVSEDDVDVVIFNVPRVFSATSLRHIKEFLKQNGLRADSKAQIQTDYRIVEV